MSKQYNGGIKLYNKVLSYDDMLKEMKGTDFDYLIYASIINWEDHPTEWNLRRDHVTVGEFYKLNFLTLVTKRNWVDL